MEGLDGHAIMRMRCQSPEDCTGRKLDALLRRIAKMTRNTSDIRYDGALEPQDEEDGMNDEEIIHVSMTWAGYGRGQGQSRVCGAGSASMAVDQQRSVLDSFQDVVSTHLVQLWPLTATFTPHLIRRHSVANTSQSGDVPDDLKQRTGKAAKPNEVRITTPYMTKYERARVLGTRALQIS
jgi:hypothetical protein